MHLRKLLPVKLVPAARLPRILAWTLDMLMMGFVQFLVLAPASILTMIPGSTPAIQWLASIAGFLLATIVLLAGMFVQIKWGRTLGKVLFQLRIVNQYGLTPGRSILSLRFLLQFLPLCGVFSPLMGLMGLEWLDLILFGLVMLGVIVSGCMVLFTAESQSLHDRLLRTRVVVDTE